MNHQKNAATKQTKLMWQNYPKEIRKIMNEPRKPYATMDYLVSKPAGYTGI